jgi:hypothetical protein
MDDKAIEVMARGIVDVNPIGCSPEEAAQAALAAYRAHIKAEGFAIVPVEPTIEAIARAIAEDFAKAGHANRVTGEIPAADWFASIRRAMIAASEGEE